MKSETRKERAASDNSEILKVFDATPIAGLRVRVHNAAIRRLDEEGEEDIEIPQIRSFLATSAVCRCLKDIRLRGWEIRAIRKIMGMTAAELANKLGEKTAAETVSRWENEKQPMGGYVEKTFRLLVCEILKTEAPGVQYDASLIAHMRVLDPWIVDKEFEVPYLDLRRIEVMKETGRLLDVYTKLQKAA